MTNNIYESISEERKKRKDQIIKNIDDSLNDLKH